MAIAAHAEPHQIGRPVQVGEACIGRASGQMMVRSLARNRQYPRTLGYENLRDHRDIRQRVIHRHQAVISRDYRDVFPADVGLSQLFENWFWGRAAGKGN